MQSLNDLQFSLFGIDGYKISDQLPKGGDDTIVYIGFVNRQGNWYIMEQNTTLGTYRYIKGASAYTTAYSGREALTYDYFYNIFK